MGEADAQPFVEMGPPAQESLPVQNGQVAGRRLVSGQLGFGPGPSKAACFFWRCSLIMPLPTG